MQSRNGSYMDISMTRKEVCSSRFAAHRQGSEQEIGPSRVEQNVYRELERAVQGIRFGSVVLTIHEGRIVEVIKTVKIRD